MIRIERFVCNPFQENCYVVSDETSEAVIVDCGAFYDEERKAIVEYVGRNNLKLVGLLSTHGHIDHNFGNNTIYDAYGLKPWVSADDEELMSILDKQAQTLCDYKLDYDMPPIGKYFRDGDVISWGNHKLRVISTPGHSPGSVFLYCEDEGLAFSGDTLFRMSIGRTDFWYGSSREMTDSLRKILATLPHSTKIYPGHGSATTIAEEIEGNPYLQLFRSRSPWRAPTESK